MQYFVKINELLDKGILMKHIFVLSDSLSENFVYTL